MTIVTSQPAPGVAPGGPAIPTCSSVEQVVATLADDRPIHCLYPHGIDRAAVRFLTGFPGIAMYAVKCNPDPIVLRRLADAGVRHFDVASVAEIDAVRAVVPQAELYFMHPVKSRRGIAYAYGAGVRHFALDSQAELAKIAEETQGAGDLALHVRLARPCSAAAYDLSGKFGVGGDEAAALLRATRAAAAELGITFHVGSQCMDPAAFARAIAACRQMLDTAGVTADVLDVGGGFPVAYPGMTPPPLDDYFHAISTAVAAHGFGRARLFAEPGRAMVAEGGSLLVKVDLRRGNVLYINDGTYGALFDAGIPRWRYPVRLVRPGRPSRAPDALFRLYGPSCDSLDVMEGPFVLPADVAEGDWIEIGQLGAYGAAMRTRFNGFYSDHTVLIDPPSGHRAALAALPARHRADRTAAQ